MCAEGKGKGALVKGWKNRCGHYKATAYNKMNKPAGGNICLCGSNGERAINKV